MERIFKILIFTDLDGSLLHRDTFKFDEIKNYFSSRNDLNQFIILFSPGCSSFDQYKNFEERGTAFNQLISQALRV